MRSIFLHAFRRNARERRRVGATLERKAKCEAFSCMPSDEMPGSFAGGATFSKSERVIH